MFFSSYPLSALSFESHIEKNIIVHLYRAVDDNSKLKLWHSTEKTAQLLEMLKSSKNDNKTKYSDITDKQIHHPKTALTPDSDKQKQKVITGMA